MKFAPIHNGKLKKPLIFVDGIDFNPTTYTHNGQIIRHGSTGWDILTMGNDASKPNPLITLPSEFSYYPTAIQQLLSAGYDIVYLDFTNGADYIQKNGLVLVELIQMVNARRQLDDPEESDLCKNAIVGASMGGQVAKWALGYMEANNIQHKSHSYVSFDSPQRGANIPLSIQAMAYLLHTLGVDSNNWNSLNTPAARQMVLETLEGAHAANRVKVEFKKRIVTDNIPYLEETNQPINWAFSNSDALRSSFKSEIEGMGYPKLTRNIGISCGSFTGTSMPFGPNAELLNVARWQNPSGGQNFGCQFRRICVLSFLQCI